MSLAPLRLLHLSPLAAIGGCEVNCLRVIEGLPECRHEVLVFDEPGPMTDRWTAAGATVGHLRAWRSGAAFGRSLSAALAAGPAANGILFWSTSRLAAVLRAVGRLGAPCAIHLGNPLVEGPVRRLRRRLAERHPSARGPFSLVACSRHAARSYRAANFYPHLPIKVVPNAVAPELISPRAHRPLPPGSILRLGMLARLDGIKDHAALLPVVLGLQREGVGAVLEFAGDGPLRTTLVRLASRLGLERQVRFLGFCDGAAALRSWDIYLHATTAEEGMGTAVAEAMASGLPCVVSDLGVMREVCADAAVYARNDEPAEWVRRIVELAAEPPARKRLGEAAQEHALNRFARRAMARSYLELVAPSRADLRMPSALTR